jgi:hypothetical protein
MLTASLVIWKHTIAVFHRKNLVVYPTVVAVLVSEIVKLLTQLSNQLILFTASDFNTRACHVCLHNKIQLMYLHFSSTLVITSSCLNGIKFNYKTGILFTLTPT